MAVVICGRCQLLRQQYPAPTPAPGPIAAGLRWHVDLTRTKTEGRLQSLEFWNGQAWERLDPVRTYDVIINDYIATGRDGYDTLATIDESRRHDTFLDYAQALVDYARDVTELRRPDPARASTQRFRDIDGRLHTRR